MRHATGELPTELEPYREAILSIGEKHGATRVGLFGSFANGTANSASDVDLWVETAPGVTLFDLAAMRVELTLLLGRPVDLLTLGGLDGADRDALITETVML